MKNLKMISYCPSLREYTGSINSAILVSYLEYCFSQMGDMFYKFLEPCRHDRYVKGDSWIEVLHMTTTEFRTAFKAIGVVYKSKKAYQLSRDKFQGKMYLSYYDRMSKLTYYMRNDELVHKIMDEVKNKEEQEQNQETHQTGTKESLDVTVQAARTKESLDIMVEEARTGESLDVIVQEAITEEGLDIALEATRTENSLDRIIDYKTKINTNTKIQSEIQTKTQSLSLKDLDNHQVIEDKVPFEDIKQLFNQICVSHGKVLEWTASQKQKIHQLWVQYDKGLEIFKKVFEKLEASDFLSGRIKSWKAQLDWLFKTNHFSDILADKYRNFKECSTKMGQKVSQMNGMLSHEWDFDEIEALERKRIDQILERQIFEIG